jgi:hypothetical protein
MLFQDSAMTIRSTYLKLILSLLLMAMGALGMQGIESPVTHIQDSTEISTPDAANEGMEQAPGYADRLRERFAKSPLLITILYIVILYSIATLITLLILILLNRSKINRDQERKDYLLEVYQEQLMDYLFAEEKRPQALKDLKRVASNHMNRQVLIDQMIDLSVNLKGDIKETIKELYFLLGLEKDSLEKAHARKWHLNVKGYRELAFMNIRDANEKIMQDLNSNNEILRMEAQIAMVRLSEGNPYEFLHLLEKPLSVWEQITLHELLIQHNLKVPAFKQWFASENIIGGQVRPANGFLVSTKGGGQGDHFELFDHEDEGVRYTAYEVCGDLGLKMALPAMSQKYPGESFNNKFEILRSFAKVPDEKYLKFLRKRCSTAKRMCSCRYRPPKPWRTQESPGYRFID